MNTHFSCVTKIRIFKNVNIRRKADHNLCSNLLGNISGNSNYIPIPKVDWLEVVII